MKNENSHMVFNFYEHFITTDYLNKAILIHIGWNIEIENYHIAIYRQISRDYWKMILRKTLLDSKETDLFHVLKAIEKKENIMQGVVNKREKLEYSSNTLSSNKF